MLNKCILSIVIPTLNRYETLLPLLTSLCGFKSFDFEIIIQDNSGDNSEFLVFYEKFKKDNRLKYFHSIEILSAIENCDLAVKKASGEFICFIGDDDGITQEMLNCCEWMKTNNVESVFFNRAIYTWPQTNHYFKFNNVLNGKLIIPNFTGELKKLNVIEEYSKIFKSGGQGMFNCPRLYHGIISKKCLDNLYSDLGTYFPGPVPDMSNCIALSKYIENHYFVDLPLVITGQSSKSMSGKNAMRKHQGEISNEKSLPKSAELIWNQRVPFYWSGPTIWAQAALEASFRINLDVSRNFNFPKLYAYCLAFTSKEYYPRVFVAMGEEKNPLHKVKLIFSVIFYLIQVNFLRLNILISKFTKNSNKLTFVNIESVISHLDSIGKFKYYK
jgi:glycosyltransferase involved in cell wall biosynthesis